WMNRCCVRAHKLASAAAFPPERKHASPPDMELPSPAPNAASEMYATKQLPGEGFKRPWPPLIRMGEAVIPDPGRCSQGRGWMHTSSLDSSSELTGLGGIFAANSCVAA